MIFTILGTRSLALSTSTEMIRWGRDRNKKINTFLLLQDGFGKFAGPGHWNDPDMLIIGNYGLSLDQVSVMSSEDESLCWDQGKLGL